MAEKPVLDAIREILKFKDYATISEIAKISGLSQKETLRRINANGHMVWRNRKTGRITKVDPPEVLRKHLWEEGRYYIQTSYDYGCQTGLDFKGHEALREIMTQKTIGGGIGDSYEYSYIPDTPENRLALEKDGCMFVGTVKFDDSLWQE